MDNYFKILSIFVYFVLLCKEKWSFDLTNFKKFGIILIFCISLNLSFLFLHFHELVLRRRGKMVLRSDKFQEIRNSFKLFVFSWRDQRRRGRMVLRADEFQEMMTTFEFLVFPKFSHSSQKKNGPSTGRNFKK